MKKYDFINLITATSDEVEEVFVEIDGVEYDLEIEEREETFDGFDTVYPSHIVIKPKQ